MQNKTPKAATSQIWSSFLLAGVTFLVFSRALFNDFIGFDDLEYVLQNPYLKNGFSASNWNWIFSFYISNWFPLTWISHLLDYKLYGLEPFGHHLTSLVIHCANAVLLFLGLQGLTKSPFRALMVAALFALHPLRVESVAWVSERKDVLAAFFALASLFCYQRYAFRKNIADYTGCLLLFLLALMSKAMPISLFLVFILLDFWPLKRLKEGVRIWFEKIPFLLLAMGSAYLTIKAQAVGHSLESWDRLSPAWRISNAFVSYFLYLWKTLIPYPLLPFYPHPAFDPSLNPKLFFCFGFLAGISFISLSIFFFLQREKRPYLMVGWLWYVVMLIPVIGFVQVGAQGIADRYTYLPLVGVFTMAVWSISARYFEEAHLRKIIFICSSIILLLCSILTWHQIGRWKSTDRLFAYVLHKNPKNFIAHSVMGGHYARQGNWEEAEKAYRNVLVHKPEYIDAYFNLIVTLKKLGKYKEAFSTLQEMIEILKKHNLPAFTPMDPPYQELLNTDRLVAQDLEKLKTMPGDPSLQKKLQNFLNEMQVPEGELPQRFKVFFQQYDYPLSREAFKQWQPEEWVISPESSLPS